jgi:hypothetical protein
MKILTNGKMLWTRTIGSTIAGEGVIRSFFIRWLLRESGQRPMWSTRADELCVQVLWEAAATPVTYRIVVPRSAWSTKTITI